MRKSPDVDKFYGIGDVDAEDSVENQNVKFNGERKKTQSNIKNRKNSNADIQRPSRPKVEKSRIFNRPVDDDNDKKIVKPRKPSESAIVSSIEHIRVLLGDSKLFDPDARVISDEFIDEDNWTLDDLTAPGLTKAQNYVRRQESSALAAVKEFRRDEREERLNEIETFDKDGSLMSLYRIWSLIPPVHRLSKDELAQMLARRVIYNQDDIIAINKPYGLSSRFSRSEGGRLAVESVLPQLQKLIAPNSQKLYIMHRLDKTTTGLLLLASSQLRASELRDMMDKKKILKKYYAIVRNIPDPAEGIIDIPLIQTKVGGRFKTIPVVRMVDNQDLLAKVPVPEETPGSLEKSTSVTEYKVLKSGRKCALVECTIKSGFTHQIRCHLGFGIGTPVLGDHKYSNYLAYLPQRLPGEMLHNLGIRSAKSRSVPMHLHAREMPTTRSDRVVSILAFAEPSYWISKLFMTEIGFSNDPRLVNDGHKSMKNLYNQRRILRFRMDSYVFSALINELRYSPRFRSNFMNKRYRVFDRSTSVVVIRLRNPDRYPLDYQWNYKVQALLNRHLELEKLMWYLSTLGGAFSALGDLTVEHAHQAGRISWEQLRIGFVLGDPVTVARCKLFIAISHIQTGRLRSAKRIIRQQYRFATSSSVSDNRILKNACLGVWSKLRYAYELRRSKRNMNDRTS